MGEQGIRWRADGTPTHVGETDQDPKYVHITVD
jgi:hypothetical protein